MKLITGGILGAAGLILTGNGAWLASLLIIFLLISLSTLSFRTTGQVSSKKKLPRKTNRRLQSHPSIQDVSFLDMPSISQAIKAQKEQAPSRKSAPLRSHTTTNRMKELSGKSANKRAARQSETLAA